MIEVVKYRAEHMKFLKEQPATAYLSEYMSSDADLALESATYAYTAFSKATGKPILCAGVHEYWPGRGEGWAIFDVNCRREFFAVHSAVKRFLSVCPINRIEAAVDVDFEAGHRWVKALGFTLEAPVLKAYRPNGADCSLYALIGGAR